MSDTVRIKRNVAAELYKKIADAGYRDRFLDAIGTHSDRTLQSTLRADASVVNLDTKTLNAITNFVRSQPALWSDPKIRAMVNCDPLDPFSICA